MGPLEISDASDEPGGKSGDEPPESPKMKPLCHVSEKSTAISERNESAKVPELRLIRIPIDGSSTRSMKNTGLPVEQCNIKGSSTMRSLE
ncbi:MAG: hypothetical protein M1812_006327 [Candelaria pacifica]|nr:MAG: hypothetical protein M1812_006327 [Candelaria pacifica]